MVTAEKCMREPIALSQADPMLTAAGCGTEPVPMYIATERGPWRAIMSCSFADTSSIRDSELIGWWLPSA